MLHLLDANVLITAHNTYYPIDRVPQFWDWIINNAKHSHIKIPHEILDEIKAGTKKDDLSEWIKRREKTLLLDEQVDQPLVNEVMERGYEIEIPTIVDLRKIGGDPFLIAYALAKPDRCVVTLEAMQSNAKPRNRKIPLVCAMLKIPCINTFTLIRELNFKIPTSG